MSAPAVRVADVFCLYPTPRGHVAALRGLTLEVGSGERVVVHGPNGSGKTTLLRVLAGERGPSAGAVSVCDVDLAGAGERERNLLRATLLGRVDQHHARTLRPELSTLDNVALQLRLAGVRAARARARAGALLDRLGLGELAHRRPGTLSGGEAQRVAVCAAVAHGPRLILADEPTGELDRAAADAVYDLLSALAVESGAALLLVSHDAGATRVADRIVRIRDGRLSEEWTPGGAGHESLVVDDRGWVRLPEALRARTGVSTRVRAATRGGAIELAPLIPQNPNEVAAPTAAQPRNSSAVAATTATQPRDSSAVAATTATQPRNSNKATATAAAQGRDSNDVAASGAAQGRDVDEVAGEGAPQPGNVDEFAGAWGIIADRGGRRVLDGQRLVLRRATLTVVRGRSGSGKSTLLRILAGLERPDSGTVRVHGVDLGSLDRAGLAGLRRRYAGVAAQSAALIETMDVQENLELVRQARGLPPDPDLVLRWLDALGLQALRHRHVRVLSGGERQRVAVARVLVSEPEIAVLDEPTSQQDEANAERLVAVLVSAARSGTAVLAATHDPVLVAAADAVLSLS